MITESIAALIALIAGISPSMGWNVAKVWPLMVLPTLLGTRAKRTPTYTERLRLTATARESPREQFVWESMLENASGRKLLMLIPDGTP